MIPCSRDCGGRSPDCHSSCQRYIKWKEEIEKKRIQRNADVNLNSYWIGKKYKKSR